MASILVVDDEIGIRDLLSEILNDEGHTVEAAENAQQAREMRARFRPDLVLLDIWMPDTDGVTLLKEWAGAGQLTMPVIMMSGHGTIDNAVEATRIGAMAFLEKPIALQKLLRAVEQGLSKPAPKPRLESGSNNLPAAEPPPLLAEQSFPLDRPLREARDDFERAYFEFHLAREGGSMTRVADKTGLERTHLYRKLKQLGVDWGRNGRRPAPSGLQGLAAMPSAPAAPAAPAPTTRPALDDEDD
ncbi:MAG: response regulator [Betaproteobacteria bacterium]|nr:response regulator [Betaproteobacteria bacterium]MBU6512454.1 response regulator [Betaproteobacteria bacterium]MDE1957405.1 response regulator [Betaproteobacteria bacterium]MDE2152668.1 response regulator [Betaproteobacteria bacterium]MDE2478316.1 response regulator [Betaproteobacteria bacterium]